MWFGVKPENGSQTNTMIWLSTSWWLTEIHLKMWKLLNNTLLFFVCAVILKWDSYYCKGPFTQNVFFHSIVLLFHYYFFYLYTVDGHVWPLRSHLASFAASHERCFFKTSSYKNFNFYTQKRSSMLFPKQWTNQKTPEAGQVLQAFVYSSEL